MAGKPKEPPEEIMLRADMPIPKALHATMQKLSRGRSVLSPIKGKTWATRNIVADPETMTLTYSKGGVIKGSIPIYNLTVAEYPWPGKAAFIVTGTSLRAGSGSSNSDTLVLSTEDAQEQARWMKELKRFNQFALIKAAHAIVDAYEKELRKWEDASPASSSSNTSGGNTVESESRGSEDENEDDEEESSDGSRGDSRYSGGSISGSEDDTDSIVDEGGEVVDDGADVAEQSGEGSSADDEQRRKSVSLVFKCF